MVWLPIMLSDSSPRGFTRPASKLRTRDQSKQLLLSRVLDDDVGRVGEIQHGAGAFIQSVQVQMAGPQPSDSALPCVMIGLNTRLISLRLA
jgi:hypothetical protein